MNIDGFLTLLREMSTADKIMIFAFLGGVIISIGFGLRWLINKGATIDAGLIKIDPKKIENSKDSSYIKDNLHNDLSNIANSEKSNTKENIDKLLLNISSSSNKESSENTSKTYKAHINTLESKIEELENENSELRSKIYDLNKKLAAKSLDKTEDFKVFTKLLKEFNEIFKSEITIICDSYHNNISNPDKDYRESIVDKTKSNILTKTRELFQTKYSGKYITEINNLYTLMSTKEEEEFESVFTKMFDNMRNIYDSYMKEYSQRESKTATQISDYLNKYTNQLRTKLTHALNSNNIDKNKIFDEVFDTTSLLSLLESCYRLLDDDLKYEKTHLTNRLYKIIDTTKENINKRLEYCFKKKLWNIVNKKKK